MSAETAAGSASPLLVDARTAAQMLGISERMLWTMTQAGELPHLRVGRRVLYPVEQLKRWTTERMRWGTHANA